MRVWKIPRVEVHYRVPDDVVISDYQRGRIEHYLDEVKERLAILAAQTEGDIQNLYLHKFFPVSTNMLMESTRFQRRDLKEYDFNTIKVNASVQGITLINPEAPVRRRIKCLYYFGETGKKKRGRRFDADNTDKSLFDALKRAGIIYDDNEVWCQQEKPRFIQDGFPVLGGYGTVIEIEDIPNKEG